MTRFIRIENGAWKAGHSGFGPEVAAQAFRLGTNSIYHSCLRYIEQTRKNRK